MSLKVLGVAGRANRSKLPAGRWPRPNGDVLAVALLLLFCLVFYHQLALAGRVLISFDALVYFYPNLTYVGASLREGRLPLWNPYLFAGAPFLANSQTGVFYPPNWLALLLPAAQVYAWSVVLHAALAALGAFAFGRRALGLGWAGALATALVFAFGGFFSAQAGHLNQLQAASWLPTLLLVGDGLLRRPRARLAALGGAILGLQLLAGHSQVAYLSLWALLLYSVAFCTGALRDGLRAGLGLRGLAVWQLSHLGPLLLLSVVGAALAAAQLLPTYELSRESIRAGGLDYDDAVSFSLPPWKTLPALLPTFGASPVFSEWVGYVGLSGLILAGLSLCVQPDRRVAAMLLVAVVALGLAFGQFNPAYVLAYRLVPGLDLFRVPARWLLLYSFGLAGLAGLGLDVVSRTTRGMGPDGPLARGTEPCLPGSIRAGLPGLARPGKHAPTTPITPCHLADEAEAWQLAAEGQPEAPPPSLPGEAPVAGLAKADSPHAGAVLLRLAALAIAVVIPLGLYQAIQRDYPLELPGAGTLLWWAAVGGIGAALVALGLSLEGSPLRDRVEGGVPSGSPARGGTCRLPRGWRELGRRFNIARWLPSALYLLLLGGELLAASVSLDLNQASLPEAVTESVPEVDFILQRPGLYRVLGVSENTFEIGRVEVFRDRVAGRLSPEGVYDYLVAMKHKKTMTPNLPLACGVATLDGYDGGVLPLRRFVGLKALFPEEGKNLPDGRLRVQLRTAPDPRVLGWLNVRYLVMDRARDVWVDGVYYDLAMMRTASSGEPLVLSDLLPFSSTSLGIVTHLEGADAPLGAEVAAITVQGDGGQSHRLPLRAGVETAEGKSGSGAAPALTPVAPWLHDPSGQEYAAHLPLPRAVSPTRIAVEHLWPRGRLAIRAISLVGSEAGAERVVDLSPDLKIVYLGDAKIYENRSALPRAFVVGRVRLVPDDEAALSVLRSPGFDPRGEAVVGEAEWKASGGGSTQLGASANVAVVEYQPERIVVEASLTSPGLLVLTDAAYPGWRASVDGRELTILRTNYMFRGVQLEPGEHRVEFVYEPASLKAGLAVSGTMVALALLAGLAGVLRHR